MEKTNIIPQAINKADIRGTVKSVTAKFIREAKVPKEDKIADGDLTDEQIRAISLEVDIETEKNNFIPVKIWTNRLKKDKTENGFYQGIKTLAKELKQGEKVEIINKGNFVTGSLNVNEYIDKKTGRLNSNLQIRSSSLNRYDERKGDFEVLNDCKIQGYIKSITEEFDKVKQEPSGNKIITLISPAYKGIATEIEILVDNPDFVNEIESIYHVGDTATFICEFVNLVIVEEIETTMALGGVRIEKEETYIRALRLVAGEAPLVEGDPNAYTPEIIEMSLKERENHLEEMKRKNEEKEKQNKPSSGGGFAIGGVTEDSDDIPF